MRSRGDIDTDRIRALRTRLIERGRASLAPPAPLDLDEVPRLERAVIERVGPMAELMFLMMDSDEVLAEEEVETLRGALRTLTEGVLRTAEVEALLVRFRRALEEEGLDARLDRVTAQLSADRDEAEMALLLVAAIAVADDAVDPAEEALFERAREWLGISEARGRALLGGS